jgi:hypothetical protein
MTDYSAEFSSWLSYVVADIITAILRAIDDLLARVWAGG